MSSLVIDTTSTVSRRRMLKLVADDTEPLLVMFTGLDMDDYSVYEAHIKYDDRTRKTITMVVTADADTLSMPIASGDLVPGSHKLEFELTAASGVQTYPADYPVILSVRDDLA